MNRTSHGISASCTTIRHSHHCSCRLGDPEERPSILPPDDSSFTRPICDPEERASILPPDDSRVTASHVIARHVTASHSTARHSTAVAICDPEERPSILPPDDSSQTLPSACCCRPTCTASAHSAGEPCGSERSTADAATSGFIIIRLREAHALASSDEIRQWIQNALDHQRAMLEAGRGRLELEGTEPLDLASAAALLLSELGSPQPLVDTGRLPLARLRELEAQASRTPWPPLNSLAAYRRIDARHLPGDEVARIVAWLEDLPWIELAYRELAANDPQLDPSAGAPSGDPLSQHQHYLDRAPLGIGARRLWPLLRGAQPVQVIDLEQGWIAHNELWSGTVPRPLYGDNRHGQSAGGDSYQGHHGTAVVGQLAAAHDRDGGAGVSARSPVYLLSHFQRATRSNGHVAAAIAVAVDALVRGETQQLDETPQRGDVLLLEVQRGLWPTEIDPADFDAIRLAVAHGLVVVEAAGNGGYALDAYRDAAGRAVFNRRRAGFRDSGAIMVGASRSSSPNNRASFSNHGSRVDCFAQGENVVTTGYGDLEDRDHHQHTQTFGGTSSAAPIVAGAALILQSLHASAAGQRLSPREMRRALADPTTGTPQGPGVAGAIGVMPNLDAIAERLGLAPRVTLRDHYGEGAEEFANGPTGVAPVPRTTCSSPDLEVSGETVILQLRNRGLLPAEVEATVYRTELATLVLPTEADRFGTFGGEETDEAVRVVVPPGSQPLAADVMQADPSRRFPEPASFLALLDYGQDPKPTLPPPRPYFRWQDFLRFNRQHAKRSVVNAQDLNGTFPFLIVGAPDRPRAFDLEILQSFPAGANVGLQVPNHLAARLRGDRLLTGGGDLEKKGLLSLPRTPRLRFSRVVLDSERPYRAIFHIQNVQQAGSTLVIRQLFEGEEVGRITWNFE